MPEVVFGQNANRIYHAFRHTDALGLERAAVIEAMSRDLEQHLPFVVLPSPDFVFIGNVFIDGQALEYGRTLCRMES